MGLRTLYLAIEQPPEASLVATATGLQGIAQPAFAQGDTEQVTLILTQPNPAGPWSNQRSVVNLAGYTFRIAIGAPGGTPIALQTSWTLAADNLSATCALNLNTSGIDSLVSGVSSALSTLSLKVNDGVSWHTRALYPVRIYAQVDDNTSNVPTPTSEYHTTVEAEALFAKRVMPAGGSITWTSQDGTKQVVQYLDNDGTMHYDVV